jgi:hypothetical protein
MRPPERTRTVQQMSVLCGFAAIPEKFVHDLLLACQRQPIGRDGECEPAVSWSASFGRR